MLTVKLCKAACSMTIVEAQSVRVTPITGGGKRIEVGDALGTSYVVDGNEYDVAYVENARGSTLQVVKP